MKWKRVERATDAEALLLALQRETPEREVWDVACSAPGCKERLAEDDIYAVAMETLEALCETHANDPEREEW